MGAFNVENLEFVQAVIKAAEMANSPVIIQATPRTLQSVGLDYLHAIVSVAASKSHVPVALHLDHGDSFKLCMRAVRAGFSSVMIDGSCLPLSENISLTKEVCTAAQAAGVPVEAELGRVGGKATDTALEEINPYTDTNEAYEFVLQTKCSSLAIGVGTAHGVYVEEPHIAQDIVCSVREAVDIPLVLHGASGVPSSQIKKLSKWNMQSEFCY